MTAPMTAPRERSTPAAVFLVAFSLLAFELALFRVLALAYWTHQAQLVLAGAMLGTGAGGTLLAIRPRAWLGRAERVLAAAPAIYAAVLVAAYRLALAVPFNVLELLWNPREILRLTALHLLLALPFLAGSLYLGLAFMARPGREHALYGANLVGAGAGAVAATVAQVHLPPERLVAVAAIAGAAGAVVAVFGTMTAASAAETESGSWRRRGAAPLIPLLAMLLLAAASGLAALRPRAGLEVKLSPYKAESQALLAPGTRVVAERNGLLGRWHAVAGPSIRYAPGLSLRSPKSSPLPEQIALFVDGEPAGAVTGLRTAGFLRELPTALPYAVGPRQRIFIAGLGGSLGVDEAFFWKSGVCVVDVAEPDASAIRILSEDLAEFSRELARRRDLTIHHTAPRLALGRRGEPYDLIMIAYPEGAGASGAGLFAARENYLLTVEGMRLALRRLAPDGILAIASWVVLPPRDGLRALATVSEALGMPPEEAAAHVMLVRSWNTTLLLASPRPFSRPQVERARAFCEENLFDLDFYPGIGPEEPNGVNQLAEPFFYRGATALLGPERADYLARYPFDLSPATDDAPYFSHFLRWRTLPALWRELGRDLVPYLEGGYVLLVGGLAEGLVVGALLLALPLFGARERRAQIRAPVARAAPPPTRTEPSPVPSPCRARVLLYFTLLGLGFMLLELAAMGKIALLVGNSGVAAALTVGGFLLFSGMGCLAGTRFERVGRDLLPAAGLWVLAAALAFPWSVDLVARWAPGLPLFGRALAALLLIAPLALPLGLFFPAGLGRLHASRPQLIPWAWSVNGFASMAGSLLGALLPLSLGFRATLALAGAAYLAAGLARPRRSGARRAGMAAAGEAR